MNKLKYIVLGIFGITLIIGFTSPLYNNLWGILTSKAYIIPKESSVFTFEVSIMNNGNGDYWLYGEDNIYFYSQMKESDSATYIKILKQETKKIELFNKTNFKTWNNEYLCGDLLKIYAKKPKNLEFISCETFSNNQTIVRATYRVKGSLAKEVEDFLVENYQMGRLKRVCCGWDTGGKYGSFEHKELSRIDPALTNIISMYGSGEITKSNKVSLEVDRNKLDYFTVTVELVIV